MFYKNVFKFDFKISNDGDSLSSTERQFQSLAQLQKKHNRHRSSRVSVGQPEDSLWWISEFELWRSTAEDDLGIGAQGHWVSYKSRIEFKMNYSILNPKPMQNLQSITDVTMRVWFRNNSGSSVEYMLKLVNLACR